MAVTPPLRYIHIDDYSPIGIDNGPDDAAFANARADLAAYGYHTLVLGQKQQAVGWVQRSETHQIGSTRKRPNLPHSAGARFT
jgi:hypothetical protein